MASGMRMSVYAFKPQFQALLRPCVRRLHQLGITANQVTIAASLISVVLGLGLAAHAHRPELFLLLPVWFFLRMACNAIDGMLAREFGQSSALGVYLNELGDVVSDAALYLPFAFVPGSSPALVGVVILLSCLSEIAGVLRGVGGKGRRNEGPMGKSDRALVFGALGLLLGSGVAAGPWLFWTFVLVALLLVVTIANRVRRRTAEAPEASRR